MPGILRPSPIIFVLCEDFNIETNGSFSVRTIFSTAMPDGESPNIDAFVVTAWTGGLGQFAQTIRVEDADGQVLAEITTTVELLRTADRAVFPFRIGLPIREGTYAVSLLLDDEQVAQQSVRVLAASPT